MREQLGRYHSSWDADARYCAPSLAAQHGHQAALDGHQAAVRAPVEHDARLDVRDSLWQGTPLGWAVHGQAETAACLRSLGAPE